MSAADIDVLLSCANCGKGEEDSNKLKKCSACLSVKYCSAACQKAHRPQHKKACKKKAAELYDEKLFKEIEPEECPICLLPLDTEYVTFKSCCGKIICCGCSYSMMVIEGKNICAFCRMLPPNSDEERVNRVNKLIDKGNAEAFNMLAGDYAEGRYGIPQDLQKANECYLKAGELGCAGAYYNLGNSYLVGRGVEIDRKKAIHYYELAAMIGHIKARHNLGCLEGGNEQRANMLAGDYAEGRYGIPQDLQKANECYLKAGELGCAGAYYNLGNSYLVGRGVEIDRKKAIHYYELAAMIGHIKARHNLGCLEGGNEQRAYKHYLISARSGMKESVDAVKEGYMAGFVTKDEYADTLRAYHEKQKEMKSDARDKAKTHLLG